MVINTILVDTRKPLNPSGYPKDKVSTDKEVDAISVILNGSCWNWIPVDERPTLNKMESTLNS